MFCGETCHVHMKVTETTDNQRKIVNSWVRCLENNQLVITSGFPTKMIENTTTVLETQYFCCCLLHFILQLFRYIFKNKTKKKKKEDGKKKVLSRIWTQYLRADPTSHSHYAIEDDRVTSWKVSNLMPFPWNFRRQTIEPYLTNWKNDSKQSDEIKANWNQATDSKKQCKRIS